MSAIKVGMMETPGFVIADLIRNPALVNNWIPDRVRDDKSEHQTTYEMSP